MIGFDINRKRIGDQRAGVDQPYEVPENPELHLMAGSKDADRLENEVVETLLQHGIL